MTAKNSVEAGNEHLEAVVRFARQMVASNRIPSDKVPDFIGALSVAMDETVAQFETVADAVATAMEKAEVKKTQNGEAGEAKRKRHPRTAKLREALRANADVDPESVPLPPIVQASRYITPKRGVGRPRKNVEPVALTPEQLAFDREFLEKHPILEGLTVENSIGKNRLTVLFDGKSLKMIKRHLETYGINFDDYKRIYSLPDDYPSVAPGYSRQRRRHAMRQGLGTPRVPKVAKSKAAVVTSESADTAIQGTVAA